MGGSQSRDDDLALLHVLGHIDEDGSGPAGAGDVERFLEDARHVLGARHQVMVLGDGPAHLDDGRFLEGVGADDGGADLAGDGDERDGIHLGVGEAGDEVGGAGSAGGHAHADLAGAAGVALGREAAALLVPRQDGAQPRLNVRQGLVDRHAGAAGIGEDDLDPVIQQALNQDRRSRKRCRVRLGHCRKTSSLLGWRGLSASYYT